MSTDENRAARVLGPLSNVDAASAVTYTLRVISLTTSYAAKDILGANPDGSDGTNGLLPLARGRYVKMTPEVDCYYVWSDNSGTTYSESASEATTPTQQVDRMYAGVAVHEIPRGRYLIVKGTSAGLLRVSVASP